jgi:putative serine/threonine protein kinase
MAFDDIPKNIESIFLKEYSENKALAKFMQKHNLQFVRLFAYGKSSWIILTKKSKTKYILKLEKNNSTRTDMVIKESKYLKLANTIKIGQKLIDYDLNAKVLLWKFVDAIPFKLWIKTAKKQQLEKLISKCLEQARKLDEIGLDHGQLAGTGTNILVKKDCVPVIVDFEKSSNKRKPHNYNVLSNLFFSKKTELSKQVNQIISDLS